MCYKDSMNKPMTIQQAMRALGCTTQRQLAIALGVNYQNIQYWRKKREGYLPQPWPEVIRARAQA